MDREAWGAAVHGVVWLRNWTELRWMFLTSVRKTTHITTLLLSFNTQQLLRQPLSPADLDMVFYTLMSWYNHDRQKRENWTCCRMGSNIFAWSPFWRVYIIRNFDSDPTCTWKKKKTCSCKEGILNNFSKHENWSWEPQELSGGRKLVTVGGETNPVPSDPGDLRSKGVTSGEQQRPSVSVYCVPAKGWRGQSELLMFNSSPCTARFSAYLKMVSGGDLKELHRWVTLHTGVTDALC